MLLSFFILPRIAVLTRQHAYVDRHMDNLEELDLDQEQETDINLAQQHKCHPNLIQPQHQQLTSGDGSLLHDKQSSSPPGIATIRSNHNSESNFFRFWSTHTKLI